jgi:thiamine biosynthesis lipoprotein
MASPCELLCEVANEADALSLGREVAAEAWRIEDKFSRYVERNIIARINTAAGKTVEVDAETAKLLDFAEVLHTLSDGAFDVTSGVLRRVWTFDGGSKLPSTAAVATVLQRVGWHKVEWAGQTLRMPAGMEIDFGGLGKEYAVDRAISLLHAAAPPPCLVNFGGDLAVTSAPRSRKNWAVGIEGVHVDRPDRLISLQQGALATSGDARRYLQKNGKRYSHVLDPRTGWPVENAAASVTVAADTCTQAGMLSTLALLKGSAAEQFLKDQPEKSWCRR